MISRNFWILAVLTAVGLLAVHAGFPSQAAVDTEEDIKYLERNIVAPCCFRQPVASHGEGQGPVVRREIRQLLTAGMTRDQVIEYYVNKYGTKILAQPPAEGFNVIAYVFPVFIGILGFFVVGMIVMNWKENRGSRRSQPATSTPAPTASSIESRIEEELKQF